MVNLEYISTQLIANALVILIFSSMCKCATHVQTLSHTHNCNKYPVQSWKSEGINEPSENACRVVSNHEVCASRALQTLLGGRTLVECQLNLPTGMNGVESQTESVLSLRWWCRQQTSRICWRNHHTMSFWLQYSLIPVARTAHLHVENVLVG